MALVGFDRVNVQQFETLLLYRTGRFEKALPPGQHRIRAEPLNLQPHAREAAGVSAPATR